MSFRRFQHHHVAISLFVGTMVFLLGGIVYFVYHPTRSNDAQVVSISNENSYDVQATLEEQQRALEEATQELQKAKEDLESLRTSNQDQLSNNEQRINDLEHSITRQEEVVARAPINVEPDVPAQINMPEVSQRTQVEDPEPQIHINNWVSDVVTVQCPSTKDLDGVWSSGSGALWDMPYEDDTRGAFITTNKHVVEKEDLSEWGPCIIGRSYSPYQTPQPVYVATVYSYDDSEDMVLLEVVDTFPTGGTLPHNYSTFEGCFSWTDDVSIGDPVYILGYPGVGGETLTVTDGVISGKIGNYWKTSAKIEQGNSGGLAITKDGCFLGMPTLSVLGKAESIGYVLDAETLWRIIDS